MTQKRDSAVPVVYIILENQQGEVLVACRQNTGYRDGEWQVPTGHIDAGETPTDAVVRESEEEIGVILKHNEVEFVHVSYRPKHDKTGARVDYYFRAREWGGQLHNAEPNKCRELRWVAPDNLPTPFTPHVREAIECIEKGVTFSELSPGWLCNYGYYE